MPSDRPTGIEICRARRDNRAGVDMWSFAGAAAHNYEHEPVSSNRSASTPLGSAMTHNSSRKHGGWLHALLHEAARHLHSVPAAHKMVQPCSRRRLSCLTRCLSDAAPTTHCSRGTTVALLASLGQYVEPPEQTIMVQVVAEWVTRYCFGRVA